MSTSWDPSLDAGRPRGDAEDESGGLRRFTPAERRKGGKKKRHKEESAREKPFKVLPLAT